MTVFIICGTAIYFSRKEKDAVRRYSSVNVFTNIITDNIPKQLANDDRKINNVLCLSEQGYTIDFKQILDGKPKLILYGGSTYCNSCIDYHLSQINSLTEVTGNNIILFFKSLTQRELVLIKTNNKLSIPIFTTDDEIGLLFESENTPCFFVVKLDMSIINTFYPVKEKPNYNNIYYKYLLNNMDKFGW